MAKELKDLTKRSENYSQWYNDLVVKADLAEQSAVDLLCQPILDLADRWRT